MAKSAKKKPASRAGKVKTKPSRKPKKADILRAAVPPVAASVTAVTVSGLTNPLALKADVPRVNAVP